MYIVRWLMGHPIIATWVLAVIAILLTFGSGNKAKDGIVDVEKNDSTSTNLEGLKADISNKLTDGKIIDKPVAVTPATTKDKTLQNEEKAVASVSATTADPKSVENTVAKGAIPKKPPFGVASKESATADNKLNAKTSLDDKSTAVADLSQSTTEEMLLMAREAYWNNGLDEAAQIYEKLIELEPKVLEHKGELGNVYWRQGYPKKAAELYSNIAIPMIEKGNSERVANMIGFIGLFYPDRAAEIHNRIQSSRQK